MKRIIVLGDGYAGVLTAKLLAKRLKDQETEITLICRYPYYTMHSGLYEVAAGRTSDDNLRLNLKRIFEGRGVKLIQGTADTVDFDRKLLRIGTAEYAYDILLLACDELTIQSGIEGAEEYGYTLTSYDDAVRLNERIVSVFREASATSDSDERKRLLSFAVAGLDKAGVEICGELAEYAECLCDRYELDPGLISIYAFDSNTNLFQGAPVLFSQRVRSRLEKLGVTLKPGCKLTAAGDGWLEYRGTEQDELTKIEIHTTVFTGVEAMPLCGQARNLPEADEQLRLPGLEGVYRVGTETGNSFRNLREMAKVAAANIATELLPSPGIKPEATPSVSDVAVTETGAADFEVAVTETVPTDKTAAAAEAPLPAAISAYSPKTSNVTVSVGGRYAAAYSPVSNRVLPSFFAALLLHFNRISALVRLLGWNRLFAYLKHEFFTVRNCRSFVGGHLSNRTPSFLLVPLRVFLGSMWLCDVFKKIAAGWLTQPRLLVFFQNASAYYESLRADYKVFNVLAVPNGITEAADAVTAATSAAVSSGGGIVAQVANPIVLDVKLLGLIRATLVSADDTAFRLQAGIVDWFVSRIVLAGNSTQIVFQILLLLLELCAGIGLVLGLFTFLSARTSLCISCSLLLTTGLYLESWWMIFAAIAVQIGGGRVFGLDCWLMPKLKKHWSKIGIVKKWYLYHD